MTSKKYTIYVYLKFQVDMLPPMCRYLILSSNFGRMERREEQFDLFSVLLDNGTTLLLKHHLLRRTI